MFEQLFICGMWVGLPLGLIAIFVGLVYSIHYHMTHSYSRNLYNSMEIEGRYVVTCLIIPICITLYCGLWFAAIPVSVIIGIAYLIASQLTKYNFKFEISSKNEKITK